MQKDSIMSRSLIIIPARLASTRFPNKVLMECNGRTLLEWTYRTASMLWRHDVDVVIATSDEKIAENADNFNGNCIFLPSEYDNGTMRAVAAYKMLRHRMEYSRIVVWQADEPCVIPGDVIPLLSENTSKICTLAAQISPHNCDPNQVRIHTDCMGNILWFSRREISELGHIGVYSFDNEHFSKICSNLPSKEANLNSLEQLTWLREGHRINFHLCEHMPLSINTEEDWRSFQQLNLEA